MKKVLIAGGSGFVGEHLRRSLVSQFYEVYILSTQRALTNQPHVLYWNPKLREIELKNETEFDVIVNLAGANLASHYWTKKRKQEIVDSRIDSTNFLKELLVSKRIKTSYFIQSSAIGIYGDRGGELLTEVSDRGHGFLAELCEKWETASEGLPCPYAITRLGVIFHPTLGALPKLIMGLRFKFLVLMGNGKQYISWIAMEDLCRLYSFLITHQIQGTYNAVSPQPVPYFFLLRRAQYIYKTISIPLIIPRRIVQFILGDLAELFVFSQKVSSRKIVRMGFTFQENTIKSYFKKHKHKI